MLPECSGTDCQQQNGGQHFRHVFRHSGQLVLIKKQMLSHALGIKAVPGEARRKQRYMDGFSRFCRRERGKGNQNGFPDAQFGFQYPLGSILPRFSEAHMACCRKIPEPTAGRFLPLSTHADLFLRIPQNDAHAPTGQPHSPGFGARRHQKEAILPVDIFDQDIFIRGNHMKRDHNLVTTPENGLSPVLRLGPEDAEDLAELEALCFDLPWTPSAFVAAFGQSIFSAFGIRENSAGNAHELVGYIAVYHTAGELEILNIAVRRDRRQRGLGRKLLQAALQAGKKTGILSAVLEVRVSNNPAIRLYESLGFQQAGRRRAYYQDTGEDALVYVLTF